MARLFVLKCGLLTALTLAFATAQTGCAQVEVTKLTSDDHYKDGIRFYRGAPYLAVTDKGGECSGTVVYLPDKRTEYVARVTAGFGSVSLTAKLEGGMMLTEFGSTSDSKAAEILVAAIAGAAAVKSMDNETQGKCDMAGLYFLEFDEGNGRVKATGKILLQ